MWITLLAKLGFSGVKKQGWIIGLTIGVLVAGGAFGAGYKFARDEMIRETFAAANRRIEQERTVTLRTARKLEKSLEQLEDVDSFFEDQKENLEQKYDEATGNDRAVFSDDELRDYNSGNERPEGLHP